jgi:hypothetical protein
MPFLFYNSENVYQKKYPPPQEGINPFINLFTKSDQQNEKNHFESSNRK